MSLRRQYDQRRIAFLAAAILSLAGLMPKDSIGADGKDNALPPKHCAYKKPVSLRFPEIKSRQWPRTATDSFVRSRLEKEGLEPSREADPSALTRRASLDLPGLPPSPEEVARFRSDSSPLAYEHAVERLLASPAY